MEFTKCLALMFYDKDNVLVGSVGIDPDTLYPSSEYVEKVAKSSLADVFSVEEAESIVYFKIEEHTLITK